MILRAEDNFTTRNIPTISEARLFVVEFYPELIVDFDLASAHTPYSQDWIDAFRYVGFCWADTTVGVSFWNAWLRDRDGKLKNNSISMLFRKHNTHLFSTKARKLPVSFDWYDGIPPKERIWYEHRGEIRTENAIINLDGNCISRQCPTLIETRCFVAEFYPELIVDFDIATNIPKIGHWREAFHYIGFGYCGTFVSGSGWNNWKRHSNGRLKTHTVSQSFRKSNKHLFS